MIAGGDLVCNKQMISKSICFVNGWRKRLGEGTVGGINVMRRCSLASRRWLLWSGWSVVLTRKEKRGSSIIWNKNSTLWRITRNWLHTYRISPLNWTELCLFEGFLYRRLLNAEEQWYKNDFVIAFVIRSICMSLDLFLVFVCVLKFCFKGNSKMPDYDYVYYNCIYV